MKVSGSLQQKNGVYYAVIRVPTVDGKAKQIWKSTKIPIIGKTKRETDSNFKKANKFLQALILENENKLHSDKSFLEWCEDWLDDREEKANQHEKGNRLITVEAYKGYYNKHIKPYFEPKRLRISDVTPSMLKSYIKQKKNDGLSNNSIIKHFCVLRGVFSEAYRLDVIPYNPCDKVKMPTKQEHEGHAYDADLSKQLRHAIENDPLKPCIMLALYSGLRRSECLGLRWSDIDFDANEIHVQNTVVRVNTLVELEAAKSKSSNRYLEIPADLRSYLISLKEKQEQNKAACGDSYADTNGEVVHVCVWPDGRMFSPDYVSGHFRLILKKAGLPKITFHELRHTCGSLLYNAGANAKQVQNYLGHSNVSTTLNIYTHLNKEKQSESSELLNGLLEL